MDAAAHTDNIASNTILKNWNENDWPISGGWYSLELVSIKKIILKNDNNKK
jgi:hypothetical protein